MNTPNVPILTTRGSYPECPESTTKAREANADMTTTNSNINPRILIKGYEVIVENCTDSAEARALVEQRIRVIQKCLAEMKAEKTLFNRHKHILSRWLNKQIIPVRVQRPCA